MYSTKTLVLTRDPYPRLGKELGSMLLLKKKLEYRLGLARKKLEAVKNRLELCARNSFYREFTVGEHAVTFRGVLAGVYPKAEVDDLVNRLKRDNLDYVDPEYSVNFGGGFIVSPWDFCYDDEVGEYTDSDGVTATVAARVESTLTPLLKTEVAPPVKEAFYGVLAEYNTVATEVYYAEGRLGDLLGDYAEELQETLNAAFTETSLDPKTYDVFLVEDNKGAHSFLCTPSAVEPRLVLAGYSLATLVHSGKEYARLLKDGAPEVNEVELGLGNHP